MRKLLLLSALLVVTTASPNYYREHYEYKEQSQSFKNNELQHKKEEAGKYAKFEDGTSAPIERSSFHKSEYHAPGTEGDSNSQLSSSIHGANAQRFQQQSASTRQLSQTGGSSVYGSGNQDFRDLGHGFGTGTSSSTYQSGRLQSGSHRIVQEPETVPTAYKREWSSHSSYKYGHGLQGHGIGHGLGHRHNNFDSSTSESQSLTQQKEDFGNIQQKQDETLHIAHHNNGARLGHSIGHGQGHYEHGRGHGYGHTSHQTYKTSHHQTGLNINDNVDTTNTRPIPQTFDQLPGTGKIIYTNRPVPNTGNSFDTQSSGTTRVAQQSTRTSSTYNSGSNVNKPFNTDDSKIYTIPQSTNVHLVPESHTGTSKLRHQTTRTYTISGTGTNTNQQFGTDDTAHSVHPVRLSNTRKVITNSDDSIPQIPFRPVQPIGTGKVTHETVRSSSSFHNTNIEDRNVPQAKFTVVPVIPSQTFDAGNVAHQTIRTSSTSQSFQTKTDDLGSVPIQTYPTRPIISSQPSEVGKTMHQTIRTSSSQSYRPNTNVDDISVPKVKFTVVPGIPSQISDTGKVTHQTIRTSSTSQSFKTKTDDVGTIPVQTYPTGPIITSQPSDTRKFVHEPIRTSSQNYKPTTIIDDTSVPKATYLLPSQPLNTGTSTHETRTYTSQHRETGTRTNTQNVDTSSYINKEYDRAPKPTVQYSDYFQNILISTTTEKVIPVYKQQPDLEPEEPKPRNNDDLNQSLDTIPYDQQKLQTSRNQQTSHQTRTVFQSSGYARTHDQKHQNENDYDDLSQKSLDQFQDITQQTQDGFGKLEFGSQHKDESVKLTQQKQHEFVDSAHYVESRTTPKPILETPTTNSQQTSRQIYRTHQRESKIEKTEFADIPREFVTPKPLPGQWKIESKPERPLNQQLDLSQQRQTSFEDQESEEDLTQQRQTGFRIVKFESQPTENKFDRHVQQQDKTEHHRFSEQRQTEYNQKNDDQQYGYQHKDVSQKIDTDLNTRDSGYRTSNSYSTQTQQHPHVIYSPIRVDSSGGQLKVFQSMQIPGGATEEMKQKLQEQMRQQLEQKMQELVQQENSQHSSKVTYSPIHVNRQSDTGKLQLYQTLQIPAGASEGTRQRLQEQLRQQLEQKMQELMQQQNSQTYHQTSHQTSGPMMHYVSGQGGEMTDCDDSEYGKTFSSSSSSSSSFSSSAGSMGGNHYNVKVRPGSSFMTTRQIQYPTGSYSY